MSLTDSSAASRRSGSRVWGGGSSNGTSASGSSFVALALAFPFPLSFPLGFSRAGATAAPAPGVGSSTASSGLRSVAAERSSRMQFFDWKYPLEQKMSTVPERLT